MVERGTQGHLASPQASVTGWVLAGGEGRRVQGQEKGLLLHRGQPLAEWVARALAPQCSSLACSANRHHTEYGTLLERACASTTPSPRNGGVWPDDPDLLALDHAPGRATGDSAKGPRRLHGPLAGILTALSHSHTEWVLVAACDTPHLPADLCARLLQAAQNSHADIAVPVTRGGDGDAASERHHWVCALIRKRVSPHLREAFVNGERKVGAWMRSLAWQGVCFAPESDFQNMNTLETLHGRD